MNDAQKQVVLGELTRLPMHKVKKEFDNAISFEIILNKYSFEDCVKRIGKIKLSEVTKLNEGRLQGLCKTCMRRKRCPEAKRYLNMLSCSAHKVHKLRGRYKTNER